MTHERLKEIKKICVCVPFITPEAGVDETQAAMRELITHVEKTPSPPSGCVRLPDGRDVKISHAGMTVLLAIADGNPLGAYVTAGILDWEPRQ